MPNLLRLIVELAEDPAARTSFRADPEAAVAGLDDLCGEDVAAAIDVARVQVDPSIADRLREALAVRAGSSASPREAALVSLHRLCDAVESAAVVDLPAERRSGERQRAEIQTPATFAGDAIPTGPPRPARPTHLRALDPDRSGGDDPDDPGPGPARPDGAIPLTPVPDPPGGFEFGVLELVSLPEGVPEAGIEPGSTATVVAVHREPEPCYEVEVSGSDGSRRFLGVVPASAVSRHVD